MSEICTLYWHARVLTEEEVWLLYVPHILHITALLIPAWMDRASSGNVMARDDACTPAFILIVIVLILVLVLVLILVSSHPILVLLLSVPYIQYNVIETACEQPIALYGL